MEDKQAKQLKGVLKSEFLPLFVGLRTELKQLNEWVEKLYSKDPPEIQKTEITNHPDQIKSVDISNLPEVIKVEVQNNPEPIKEISIANIVPMFGTLHKAIGESVGLLKKTIEEIKTNKFKVEIQNNPEFPKDIKVNNLKDIIIPKVEIPTSVKINNYLPEDAIPVILTSKDRKAFYNAFQQMFIGNDVNLDRIVKAIGEITIDADEINIDLDDVEKLLQDIIDILGGTSGDIKEFYGEFPVLALDEDILITYLVPTGKTFYLEGFSCQGEDNGLFKILVNSNKIWQGRLAWTSPTISGTLKAKVNAGQTIYLKIENLKNKTTNFSGSIYGNQI